MYTHVRTCHLLGLHTGWQLNTTTSVAGAITRHSRRLAVAGWHRLAVGAMRAVGNGRSPVMVVVSAALLLRIIVTTALRFHAVH